MALEVDTPAAEAHPLGTEPPTLNERAAARAGRDPASGSHHAVPGDRVLARLGQGPKRPADRAGSPGDPQERRDLTVGGDAPEGDLLDEVVDAVEEARPRSRWGQVCGYACGGVLG